MKPLFLTLLAIPLAGCPALDIIEGNPSAYKAAHEQRMALVTPVVASVAEPVIEPVIEPEPVIIAEPEPEPLPPCTPTFRINRCGPNNEVLPW